MQHDTSRRVTTIARHAGIVALIMIAALTALTGPAAAGATAGSTTVLRFTADGGEWVEGTLQAGRPVVIDYDMDRLPTCRNRYAGGDAWSIGVYVRIDGGTIERRPVTRLDENRHNVKIPVSVDLPPGARDLELWFHAGDRAGCSEYDSRYGANYHYGIEQPAA